ncbi:MAG TPA: carboxypeptidase-like regulatory domain-containing protein [Candidatus Eremiobacteraceae bacterium]|nr:carboxypeptidase-like regulatory domain-containing protein [Candidatus Eremiobacteraceae bacterium]
MTFRIVPFSFALAALIAGFGWGTGVLAESAGVYGTVSDPVGAPLQDVAVRVAIGPSRGAAAFSGRGGAFRFLGLEPGFYELVFSRTGFNNRIARFELCPGEQAEVDPVLVSHMTMLDARVFGKTPHLSMSTSGTYVVDAGNWNRQPSIVCL